MQPVRQEDIDEAVKMLGPSAEGWLREFHTLVAAKQSEYPYDRDRFKELKVKLEPFMRARFERALEEARNR